MATFNPSLDCSMAAIELGVTVETLAKWRRENKGPKFYCMGKEFYYRFNDLKKFLSLSTKK